MAQRLPDSLPMNAPRGVRPPAPEDQRALRAGLNAALEGAGMVFARKADDDAVEALTEFQTSWQAQAAERAAAYDGSRPGFAAEEAARFEQDLLAFEKTRVGRSARGAFRQRADEAKAGYVGRAIAIEGQARAGVVAERREALDRQALDGTRMAYQAASAAKIKPLYDNLDPADDGFVDKVTAERAGIIGELRETVPERLRPRFDSWASAGAAEEQAAALRFREESQEKALRRGAFATIREAGNQVIGDPDLYGLNRQMALDSIAALPDDEEAELRPRIENDMAVNWVKGLVAAGREGEAVEALESGKLDKLVEDKAGLLKYAQNGGKSDMERYVAALDVQSRMEAELDDTAGGGDGGQVSLDEISRMLSPQAAAEHQARLRVAKAQGQATKALPDLSRSEVEEMALAPEPDPDLPDYTVRKAAWERSRAAARAELGARDTDAAAWAYQSESASGAGPTLKARSEAIMKAPTPKARAEAARSFTNLMIWRQEAVGADPSAWRLQTKADAKAKVAKVTAAKPEQKAEMLRDLGAWVTAFPATAKDNSGRAFSPRQIVIRELTEGGLIPPYAALLMDFGDDGGPGGVIDQFAGALNQGEAGLALPDKKQEESLKASVSGALRDYFASTEPLAGAKALNDPREGLVRMLARSYVVRDGMGTGEAARKAAGIYNSDVVFVEPPNAGGRPLRLPKALGRDNSRVAEVRTGLTVIRHRLLADDAALVDKTGVRRGSVAGKQGVITADALRRSTWVTKADDSGVVLMMPLPDGTWEPVRDKWGRPVAPSWDQSRETLTSWETPALLKPPAPPPKSDKLAAPVAARGDVFDALVGAVVRTETGSNPRQVSVKGAVGKMQLKPDTARAAARRLGVPFDEKRLLNDHAYNERLGREELRHLLKSTGHPILALVGYNAGPGVLQPTYVDSKGRRQVGWLARFGDPRKGGITWDQWVAKIPYDETRNYVLKTLPDAYKRLTAD